MKQETLEEAAERYSNDWERITGLDYSEELPEEINKIDFINGAKWQEERSYSEEEVIDLLQEMNDYPTIFEGRIDIKEWFDRNKKK